jgi:hypoxanthine phosphoribosyltransferase
MKFVEWNGYTELLKKLFEEIKFSDFDGIVAIGRGGSIIAAYLGSKFGIPTFTPVFVRHVRTNGEIKLTTHDECGVRSLRGRLLVVDDSLIHGRAMRLVLGLLSKNTSARTLAMYCRKGSEFKPDFVGAYVDESEKEIIFPYDPP